MKQLDVGIRIKRDPELVLSLSLFLLLSSGFSLLPAIGIKKGAHGGDSIEDLIGSLIVAPRAVTIMRNTFHQGRGDSLEGKRPM